MQEPLKHEYIKGTGKWIISKEWRQWKADTKKVKTKQLDEENHIFKWKEIARHLDTGRTIFFCSCMSGTNEPYRGCGAVAIQHSRASKLQQILESRFA